MKTFDYQLVKDPTYFSDGRVAAHSDHRYFASREAMELGEDSFRFCLNGLWKFHYAKNYDSTVPDLKRKITAAGRGTISGYLPISRWKDMTRPSTPMCSIPGRAMRN